MKNDYYAKFMTQILKNLETRYIKRKEIISEEQDDCLEVLFVMHGRYNVGYEINKLKRFRKQFG